MKHVEHLKDLLHILHQGGTLQFLNLSPLSISLIHKPLEHRVRVGSSYDPALAMRTPSGVW